MQTDKEVLPKVEDTTTTTRASQLGSGINKTQLLSSPSSSLEKFLLNNEIEKNTLHMRLLVLSDTTELQNSRLFFFDAPSHHLHLSLAFIITQISLSELGERGSVANYKSQQDIFSTKLFSTSG